jgi:GNAT superfamily N-acetyltransferase
MEIYIKIRPADQNDIDKILIVSKKAFPMSLKENIPGFINNKYWKILLNSESRSVFILSLNEQIIAYNYIISNISKSKKEFKQKISFLMKLLIFFGKIFSLFSILISRNVTLKEIVTLFESRFFERFAKPKQNKADIVENDSCWCEAIAISPEFQGKGYGKKLLKHAIKECQKLDKKYLGSTVLKNNFTSKNLFYVMGFKEFKSDDFKITFIKYLCE